MPARSRHERGFARPGRPPGDQRKAAKRRLSERLRLFLRVVGHHESSLRLAPTPQRTGRASYATTMAGTPCTATCSATRGAPTTPPHRYPHSRPRASAATTQGAGNAAQRAPAERADDAGQSPRVTQSLGDGLDRWHALAGGVWSHR